MRRWGAALALGLALAGTIALIGLVPGASAVSPAGHYLPRVGDRFTYAESVVLDQGTGNYTGYTEATFTNGSVGVSAITANGTDTASFANRYAYSNNQGSSQSGSDVGAFTFSAKTFDYVNGTDNQTGYTAPIGLWFYLNNSLPTGGPALLLNTPVTVQSTNTTYQFPSDAAKYVVTLYVAGTGSYQRDDVYGVFAATYTWQAYFDPSTGYIVGYLYTEHDTDPAGNGFTWTDTLSVTTTSYPLTPANAPVSSSAAPSDLGTYLVVGVVVVIVVAIVVAVALRRRRAPLPAHSATGRVEFSPTNIAPPPPPGSGAAPPPIDLTPRSQPAVQQVVLRETVKVKCAYCGALIDSTAAACPGCGAPRR